MKTKKDILELLLELSEKVEDIRCRAIDIDLKKSDEEQFAAVTNKGDLFKYKGSYDDIIRPRQSQRDTQECQA